MPVTTASDAHDRSTVADHRPELRALLDSAGYTSIAGYRARHRYDVLVVIARHDRLPERQPHSDRSSHGRCWQHFDDGR